MGRSVSYILLIVSFVFVLAGVSLPLFATSAKASAQPVKVKTFRDPRHGERSYRQFVLPNQLKVVVVSDPTIQKAAASLIVNAGSMSDPKGAQGLAHFVEHMLFLGTKKYPKVNALQRFLSKNGGSSNAYTAETLTNYFFDVDPNALKQALNRYAQFFISPLFTKKYLSRERHAVNSEHQKNILNDHRRIAQLMRIAFKAGHPAQHFATGNLKTLRGVTKDALLTFYHQHYSSNQMQLVVVGNQTLDQLEKWVRADFSDIKNRHLQPFRAPKEIMPPSNKYRLLSIKTVKNIRQLKLIFPMPPLWATYQSGPVGYLGFLFGHEGQGSLLSRLKVLGLANHLAAGSVMNTRWYSAMGLTFSLTQKGVKNINAIITEVFDYAKLLKHSSLPKGLYDEVKTMQRANFLYAPKQAAEVLASHLNQNLRFYPLKTVIHGSLIRQYKPALFNHFLAKINPKNMLVIVAHQQVKGNQHDPYYGTHYSYRQTKDKQLKAWLKPKGDPALTLPKPNPFIPKDFTLLPTQTPFVLDLASMYRLQSALPKGFSQQASALLKAIKPLQDKVFTSWTAFSHKLKLPKNKRLFKRLILNSASVIPINIKNSKTVSAWFVSAPRFKLPKTALVMRFITPKAYDTVTDAALTALYVYAMNESLNEYRYQAEMAGLSVKIQRDKSGITLDFYGYSDQILAFADTIIRQLKTISIDKASFQRIKEQRIRWYKNFEYRPSYQQGIYYAMAMVEPHRFFIDDYLKVLPSIDYAALKAFPLALYHSGYWQMVVLGNTKKSAAKRFVARLSTFMKKPYPKADWFKEQMILLPKGTLFKYQRQTKLNMGSAVMVYQLGHTTPSFEASLMMINKLFGPEFYTTLRTKQQLGYLVFSNQTTVNQLLMEYFAVQSKIASPKKVNQRIAAFISAFLPMLKALTPAQFSSLQRATLKDLILRPDAVLAEATKLFNRHYRNNQPFNQTLLDIKALLSLKRKDLIQVYKRYFINAPRRVSVSLYAQSQPPLPLKQVSLSALRTDFLCKHYCLDHK